jgi:hypothetical protein
MMDEEDNMDPTERSMLPIIIGNVSPAATRRKTVEMVSIPVMFLILENGGIKIEKVKKMAAKSIYGKILVSISKRDFFWIVEIKNATPLLRGGLYPKKIEQPALFSNNAYRPSPNPLISKR